MFLCSILTDKPGNLGTISCTTLSTLMGASQGGHGDQEGMLAHKSYQDFKHLVFSVATSMS